jgi:hypothetical protein
MGYQNTWSQEEMDSQNTKLGCIIPISIKAEHFNLSTIIKNDVSFTVAQFYFDTYSFPTESFLIYYGKLLDAKGFTFDSWSGYTIRYTKTTTKGDIFLDISSFSGRLGYLVSARVL